MAIRTISNAGGNYNNTATWGGLSVPTSADDVVSTATSGQLTVNVASAARSIDLSTYTNTVTVSANWVISGSSVTNTFGSGMNFAGTVGTMQFTGICTVAQNTTNEVFNLSFATGAKTFATDIYCTNLTPMSTVVMNGNNIYVSGNLGSSIANPVTVGSSGTTRIVCVGSGFVQYITGGTTIEINTTGTYSTVNQGLVLNSTATANPSFVFTSGNVVVFNIILVKNTTRNDDYILDLSRKVSGVYIYSQVVNSGFPSMSITALKPIHTDLFTSFSVNRLGTTDNTEPTVSILGGGLSASVVNLFPIYRSTSQLTNTPPTYIFKGINLKLNSDYVHNVGSFELSGGGYTSNALISSITASLPASINLASKITSQIVNYNFTDIDATGQEIVAINATLLRTTNVTNVYPTGGGGGVAGGSFTYVN